MAVTTLNLGLLVLLVLLVLPVLRTYAEVSAPAFAGASFVFLFRQCAIAWWSC